MAMQLKIVFIRAQKPQLSITNKSQDEFNNINDNLTVFSILAHLLTYAI